MSLGETHARILKVCHLLVLTSERGYGSGIEGRYNSPCQGMESQPPPLTIYALHVSPALRRNLLHVCGLDGKWRSVLPCVSQECLDERDEI